MNSNLEISCHANINNLQCRVTGILILISSLGCLKEVKTIEIVFFLIFSNIRCRYTLELPL